MHAVLEMWNGATTDDLPTLLAPTYRGHMLGAPDGERDAAAYPATVAATFSRPFYKHDLVEQFDAGDRLVTRLRARRAKTGDGPALISHGMNIARFYADARLAEEWAIWSAWQESTEETDT